MNPDQTLPLYPNVKARLRLIQQGPSLPEREYYMDLWLKERRFRVRDEAGRDLSVLLGDLAAPRGLGLLPDSLEEIMDIWSETQAPHLPHEITELYGDLATNKGLVFRWQQAGWPIAATALAPLAEQILAHPPEQPLTLHRQVARLGKMAMEYQFFLAGTQAGHPYKSMVTHIVAPPYLLFSHVHDVVLTHLAYTREVVTLEEGVVTEAELTPP